MSRSPSIVGQGRRVEFLSVLGRGGFGAVYLADLHGRDGFVQRVAIKVLNELMSESADIAARQRDEARLLARLNHDHIVKVYDLTEVHRRPAVIMEYVQGVDLALIQRQGPLAPRVALQAVACAASALDAAWRTPDPRTGRPLRVVHRDIKPSNLLLSKHGGLKVLDFGIARGDFDREGATGSVQFGTTRFMAPEQWLYRSVSDKVDVYALGVTFVELLAGATLERAPLDEVRFADHMAAAVAAVVGEDVPPRLADMLRELLSRMLAFDPKARPSAAEVHDQALQIADELNGESLGRYARRVVPPLLDARSAQHEHDPLLSSARIDTPATAGPPAVAAPKLASEPYTPPTRRRPRPTPPPVPAPADPAAGTVPYRAIQAQLAKPTAPQSAPRIPEPTARRKATLGALLVGLLAVVATRSVWPTEPAAEPETVQEAVHDAIVDAREPIPAGSDSGLHDAPEAEEPLPVEVEPVLQAPRAPIPDSKPAAPAASSDTPMPVKARPDAAASPEATRPPEPALPVPPADADTPTVPTRAVTITSSPIGARVSVDGRSLAGTTPMRVQLEMGAHQVHIQDSSGACQGTLTVSSLAAGTYRCTTATAALEAIR